MYSVGPPCHSTIGRSSPSSTSSPRIGSTSRGLIRSRDRHVPRRSVGTVARGPQRRSTPRRSSWAARARLRSGVGGGESADTPDPVPAPKCRWRPSISAGGCPPALAAYPGFRGRATLPLLGLAPGGVYRAVRVTPDAGALLPHRFTLTCAGCPAIGGLFSVALFLRVTPTGRYPAPCPMESGRSSAGSPAASPRWARTRPPGRLTTAPMIARMARGGAWVVPSRPLGGAATDGRRPDDGRGHRHGGAGIRGNDRRDASRHHGGPLRRSRPRGPRRVPRLPR